MPCTLRDYHFSPAKLAQILKQLMRDGNISAAYLSKATGISRDTIDNILGGRVQDVKFEQMAKICCVLETPMTVIEMLLLTGDDVEFADSVLCYDPVHNKYLPITQVDTEKVPTPDTAIVAAEAVAAAETPSPAPAPARVTEYISFLQAHVDRLTRLLEVAMQGGHPAA